MDEPIEQMNDPEQDEVPGVEATAFPSDEPLCALEYRLNEEEVLACLNAEHPRSRTRLWVQSAILAALAAYWLIGFATDSARAVSSLIIGAACLLLIVAIWLVPPWENRRHARQLAETAAALHVQVYSDRLEFGGSRPMTVARENIRPRLVGNVLVLDIVMRGGNIVQSVGIPRRVTDEETFARLLSLFPAE